MTVPPGSVIHTRPMRPEDTSQVHAIDLDSFSLPWPESAYAYELKENPQSLLRVAERVTEQGTEIVGMIVVWLVIDEAHIATIAVRPDCRGQGIGARLLAEALVESARRGMSAATLEVRAGNLTAQRLYARFNFTVAGRRPGYYRDNREDALIMTLASLDEDYLRWLERAGWAETEAG